MSFRNGDELIDGSDAFTSSMSKESLVLLTVNAGSEISKLVISIINNDTSLLLQSESRTTLLHNGSVIIVMVRELPGATDNSQPLSYSSHIILFYNTLHLVPTPRPGSAQKEGRP